jgi:hypothetical protein
LDLLTIAVETGLLADKGLAGRDIEARINGLGVRLLRLDRRDEPARNGNLGGIRQWIESIYDSLKSQLGLEHHRRLHHSRSIHPHRPKAARPGRRDMAQLGHGRPRQAQPHRLRPLDTSFKESII